MWPLCRVFLFGVIQAPARDSEYKADFDLFRSLSSFLGMWPFSEKSAQWQGVPRELPELST